MAFGIGVMGFVKITLKAFLPKRVTMGREKAKECPKIA
jgi:hypothetical protein